VERLVSALGDRANDAEGVQIWLRHDRCIDSMIVGVGAEGVQARLSDHRPLVEWN
jgi:hypothetical protein